MGATFGAAGVAIVVAGEAADLLNVEQLVLPGMVGVVLAGGAGFVFGPAGMMPAFVWAPRSPRPPSSNAT